MRYFTAAIVLTLCSALSAQEYLGERDFLTTYEADLIREAQEPNLRIETYLELAALRIELVKQLMGKEDAGRGAKIHRNLEEYGRILEAIDMVIDILTERGYFPTADCIEHHVPVRLDPETNAIINAVHRVWLFDIRFPSLHIRRGGH